ncbi:MAG: CAF17-like 4Fe-4S cluster assembly/insertion protein YgfZ [Methylosarcina sp.]
MKARYNNQTPDLNKFFMNQNWTQFLLSQQAVFTKNNHIIFTPEIITQGGKQIYPVPHLAVLKVTGKDAAKLLQGQMTCNVNDITETQGSLGAFCNPKGRAIATFLLIKSREGFLLVLPVELLQTVKSRLQKYVLRSDAAITEGSDEFCLIGLRQEDALTGSSGPLFSTHRQEVVSINLSLDQNRSLILAEADQAAEFWSQKVQQENFQPTNSERWRYLDLVSGLPWLGAATSEEFIPQMLNLDKLGGISFNKGCYTGQEIVARTHYLGKVKRTLFLAECDSTEAPEPSSIIVDNAADPAQSAGNIVDAIVNGDRCKAQVVLQLAEDHENHVYDLSLKDRPDIKLHLISFES